MEKEEKKEESLVTLLAEIRHDLESEAGASFQEDDVMWKGYEKWCRSALETYGNNVYGELASWSTFNSWVRRQKAGRGCVCWDLQCLGDRMGFDVCVLMRLVILMMNTMMMMMFMMMMHDDDNDDDVLFLDHGLPRRQKMK